VKDISIIVTCREQQPQLRQLLPELLSMQYEGEFEVIVVDEQHDKDFGEWLEEMEVHYPHLSHTFCPASSRGIETRKLALTLGAKAANYEWLVALPADVKPESRNRLQELIACLGDENDVVIGITKRKWRWKWFRTNIYPRKTSLFRPTSAIILCSRRNLLQGGTVKLSDCKVVKIF
jgi:cellulose synthase/poly-beta-1,6-N-acetylglucosamine synthase-like glycosyltransferase